MTPHIRRAGPADAALVRTLTREIAAHQGCADDAAATDADWRTMLSRDDVIVLLAECDADALGYVSATRRLHLWTGSDILGLDDLYVRPHARDAGVGRLLMLALARLAAADQLVIRWEVEHDNHAAQRFYARLGAGLHTKTIAGWGPARYGTFLT